MSGGSYDYLYSKVDEMADGLMHEKLPIRRAFGKHLKLVAKAMHDIEWVDSSDYGKGDEIAAIDKVLGANSKTAQLSILKEDAENLIKQLQEALK